MNFPDLRAFLDRLGRDRDLATIDAPVDAHLEAAEIHRRVIAASGPALLFTNVAGADTPPATNLFGTARRAELAFGDHASRTIEGLVRLVSASLPPSLETLWKSRGLVTSLLKIGLSHRKSGPVTQVVTDDVRLDRLPILTTWPE